MLHRHHLVASHRSSEAEQGLTVDQVEQLHQGKIVHLAAAVQNQPGGHLRSFVLVKREPDWFQRRTMPHFLAESTPKSQFSKPLLRPLIYAALNPRSRYSVLRGQHAGPVWS